MADHLYHLVPQSTWQACKQAGKQYFPPTYSQDGFIHLTKDPKLLLPVANHFYRDVEGAHACSAFVPLSFRFPAPTLLFAALPVERPGICMLDVCCGGLRGYGSRISHGRCCVLCLSTRPAAIPPTCRLKRLRCFHAHVQLARQAGLVQATTRCYGSTLRS